MVERLMKLRIFAVTRLNQNKFDFVIQPYFSIALLLMYCEITCIRL